MNSSCTSRFLVAGVFYLTNNNTPIWRIKNNPVPSVKKILNEIIWIYDEWCVVSYRFSFSLVTKSRVRKYAYCLPRNSFCMRRQIFNAEWPVTYVESIICGLSPYVSIDKHPDKCWYIGRTHGMLARLAKITTIISGDTYGANQQRRPQECRFFHAFWHFASFPSVDENISGKPSALFSLLRSNRLFNRLHVPHYCCPCVWRRLWSFQRCP